MPPLSKATQKPTNIGEQIPVTAPVVAGGPPAPPYIPNPQPGLNPFAAGPAPAVMTTPYDSVRQFTRPGTSQSRFPALPTKANPQPNASASSVATRVVKPVSTQAAAAQTTATAAQATANAALAVSFQGAYSATVSYAQGASVDSGGTIYVSLVNNNLGNTPASSPTDWQAVGGQASYIGVWSGSTNYTTGQTVSISSSLYIALQNSTNENPTTTTGYWALISGSTIFYGAFSSSAVYPAGAEVSYKGSFWIALSAVSAGNTPAPGSSYWENVGTAAILLAAYSGSVTYSIGMEVVGSDGNVYQWINSTPASGEAPPNATYWQLIGPANLDSLADGTTYKRVLATALTSNAVDPSQAGVLMKGSVPPALTAPFFYISTTSQIEWEWYGQGIFRADGTVTNIADSSQTVTGLTANTTYYFYPYFNEGTSALDWLGSEVVTPNVTGVFLDGASSPGYVTTTTSFTMPTTFSFSCWFKTTSTAVGVIFSINSGKTTLNTTNAYPLVEITAAGLIYLWAASGSEIATTAAYNDGNWHCLGISMVSGGTSYIVVDGVIAASGTVTTGTSFTGYMWLGQGSLATVTREFQGTISRAAYYTSALNASNFAALYNAQFLVGASEVDVVVSDLSASYYWKLIETSGTSAADSIGSNTGTYQGTPDTSFKLDQVSAVLAPVGSPAIAWSMPFIQGGQYQNLQGRVPLSSGAMAAATPATGSGGGSGGGGKGGGGGCFSPNTRLVTKRGNVPFSELTTEDLILTGRKTFRKAKSIQVHDFDGMMLNMGDDELVTPTHPILVGNQWPRAHTLFTDWIPYKGKIFNAEMETEELDNPLSSDTEHSYVLANGQICHNIPFIK
jgi:hypothetical protein